MGRIENWVEQKNWTEWDKHVSLKKEKIFLLLNYRTDQTITNMFSFVHILTRITSIYRGPKYINIYKNNKGIIV
jgi:hypothetical protein